MSHPRPHPPLRQVMSATIVGHVAEWYDYAVYALVAIEVGAAFFPSQDGQTSLLAALAVFGIAFIVRPLAGIGMGALGDKLGRKTVLVASLMLMTFATTLVGVLPGADVIGIAAPALLILARLLQGVSAAGESPSAVTFIAESVPAERKGRYTATLYCGSSGGFLLATLVVWAVREVVGETDFAEWGWRIPFLLALPLGLTGLVIRKRLAESPVFEELRSQGAISANPVRDSLTKGIGQVVQAICLSGLSFVGQYLLVAYLPIHLKGLGMPSREISQLGVIVTATQVVVFPFLGAISDRIGRRAMLQLATGSLVLFGWPLFAMMSQGDFATAIPAALVLAIANAAFIACMGLFCTEFINKSRLMTTFSTGFNAAGAIFGGSCLWVFGKLTQVTGDPRMPAVYLVLTAALSFATILTIRKRPQSAERP